MLPDVSDEAIDTGIDPDMCYFRDGVLSYSLSFALATSNEFAVVPQVLSNRGRLSVDQLQVQFRTDRNVGRFWLKIFYGNNAKADINVSSNLK